MADTTTYLKWTIPTKWDDDWYDEFLSLMNEIDAAVYAVQDEVSGSFGTNLYVNSDYVSGDEDAYIYFNARTQNLKYDYGNSQFELSDALKASRLAAGNAATTPSFAIDLKDSAGTLAKFESTSTNLWIRLANSADGYGYVGYEGTNLTFWVQNNKRAILSTVGTLRLDGSLEASGYLVTNYYGAASAEDAIIYFGGHPTSYESLKWDAASSRFEFSDDLYVAGTLSVGGFDLSDDHFNVNSSKTPSASTAPGTQGDVCWDSDYVYVCIATNTWGRAELDFAF